MEKYNVTKIDTFGAYRALRCICEGMIEAWDAPRLCTECPFDRLCSDVLSRMKKFIEDNCLDKTEDYDD